MSDDILMQKCWGVIKEFIQDWQKYPYAWGIESEMQAEIYRRLTKVFEDISKNKFKGRYVPLKESQFIVKELKDHQLLNRVSCGPTLAYRSRRCRPDIVIWGENGPRNANMYKDWPILFACELKIAGMARSRCSKNKKNNTDIEKLNSLLETKRAQYGCLLVFYYRSELKYCNAQRPIPELKKGEKAMQVDIDMSTAAC